MGSTCDKLLQCQYTGGVHLTTDADYAEVRCGPCDSDGTFTGPLVALDVDANTTVEMTQVDPGRFTYQTSVAPFTRGDTYKAIYDVYVGATLAQTITQVFVAESKDAATRRNAAHFYTIGELRDVVRQALGLAPSTVEGGPIEPGSADSLDIVNDALLRVWNAHEWTWKPADTFYIEFAAGQFVYTLPAEYGGLVSVHKPGQDGHEVVRRPIEDIRHCRHTENNSSNGYVWYYDVTYNPDATEDEGGRYVLEIYPTPTTYSQNGLVVEYLRELTRFCSDSDYPPIPAGLTDLVKCACRLEAFEAETDPRAGPEMMRFDRMLSRSIANDDRRMGWNFGSLVERRFGDDEEDDSSGPRVNVTITD